MDTIAKRMTALREALELGQTEAAGKLGIKQSSLWLIESGDTKSLAGKTLVNACRLYKTTPDFIMHGAGYATDEESAMLEAELVHTFRSSSPDVRRSIVGAARGLAEQAESPPAVFKQSIGDSSHRIKEEIQANVPVTIAAKAAKNGKNPSAGTANSGATLEESTPIKGSSEWSKRS